jgi:tetrahydromethanopterin S-methyltransferase subunit B
MKKLIWLFSIISFLFIGCGGNGSNKEAKELLQKILQVVGIPYDIVINICQDDNNNGICESFELQTKITLSKGDSFEDIFEKIKLTEDGKYFLETRDPKKPILLELQDRENVFYNDGKFTLTYKGFKTYEDNETKELSILTSMVDNGFLREIDIDKIRDLNNQDTQNRFYSMLLSTLEKNINTLFEAGFDIKNALLADLKEMSIGLIQDGIRDSLPQDLNNCGNNMECVDSRLKITESKITITKDKANAIKDSYILGDEDNSNSSNENKLLVSKISEEYKTYNSNGDLIDSTLSIITYKYNGDKLINYHQYSSTSYTSAKDEYTEDCSLTYDSDGKFIEESCRGDDGSVSKYEVIYDGDRVVEKRSYEDNKISNSWRVLEWSNNKPIKVELINYDENGNSYTGTEFIEYDSKDNPIRVIWDYEYETVKVKREFDNNKNPFYWLSIFQDNSYYAWTEFWGKNNVIKEISDVTYKDNEDYKYSSTKIYNINYNGSNMPIRVESKEVGSEGYKTITTTKYEYIELK